MTVTTQIIDGGGKGVNARVVNGGSLLVVQDPAPPFEAQKTKPFRQYLTVDGLSTGSSDLGVNGSVTPVDFWVPADQENDRYITNLSIIVGYGGTSKPYLWADGAALTNGGRLFYTSLKGEVDIHDAIKTNQDMFRLQSGIIPTTWEVRHVNANNDYGYFIYYKLLEMVPPYGIKLDAGTNQKLTFTVRDNDTVADSFNIIATGFDRFPDKKVSK